MSTSRIYQMEEMNQEIRKMMQDRQERDIARNRELNTGATSKVMPVIEKPLTRDEINEKIHQMMKERNERDIAAGRVRPK